MKNCSYIVVSFYLRVAVTIGILLNVQRAFGSVDNVHNQQEHRGQGAKDDEHPVAGGLSQQEHANDSANQAHGNGRQRAFPQVMGHPLERGNALGAAARNEARNHEHNPNGKHHVKEHVPHAHIFLLKCRAASSKRVQGLGQQAGLLWRGCFGCISHGQNECCV